MPGTVTQRNAQVCEWTEELEKMLKAVREERAWLARELEEEKLLLPETKAIGVALEEKRGRVRSDNGGRSSERYTHVHVRAVVIVNLTLRGGA